MASSGTTADKPCKMDFVLEDKYNYLLENLQTGDLLVSLVKKQVISESQKSHIAIGENDREKTERLLQLMKDDGSDKTLDLFLAVLKENRHRHVFNEVGHMKHIYEVLNSRIQFLQEAFDKVERDLRNDKGGVAKDELRRTIEKLSLRMEQIETDLDQCVRLLRKKDLEMTVYVNNMKAEPKTYKDEMLKKYEQAKRDANAKDGVLVKMIKDNKESQKDEIFKNFEESMKTAVLESLQ